MFRMVNLSIHFLLELCAMAALVRWGFITGNNWQTQLLLGIVLPLGAAIIWGVFRVPNDPGPATVAVPGYVRLVIEWGIFALAAWSLFLAGQPVLAWGFIVANFLNYALMIDRIVWLLQPYLVRR